MAGYDWCVGLDFFSVECLEEVAQVEFGVCLQFKHSSDDFSGLNSVAMEFFFFDGTWV
jgi:hypothetical protein